MSKFVGLRAKTHSYLIDDGSENKKANITKNLRFIKKKHCLESKINFLTYIVLKKL